MVIRIMKVIRIITLNYRRKERLLLRIIYQKMATSIILTLKRKVTVKQCPQPPMKRKKDGNEIVEWKSCLISDTTNSYLLSPDRKSVVVGKECRYKTGQK